VSGGSARPAGAPRPDDPTLASEPVGAVRVRWSPARRDASVTARSHAFSLRAALAFAPADSAPSAAEYLLGALAGDLVTGFARHAARRGVVLDDLEAAASGTLHSPLTALGVIGEETGDPAFDAITVTLYVASPADPDTVRAVWEEARRASPTARTLERAVRLTLTLRIEV